MKINSIKPLTLSVLFGAVISIVGVNFMGYVMAIAIPPSFFSYFDNPDLSLFLVAVFNQLLTFTLLALVSGYLLGKVAQREWRLNALLCYLTFLFIMVFAYSVSLRDLFGLGYIYNITNLLTPIALFLSAYLGQKSTSSI